MQVKYITTSINGDNFKYLKTKRELENMNAEDNNIFKKTTYDYYMKRPPLLETNKYIDYFQNYEIILKSSKRKLPIKSIKYTDLNGRLIFFLMRIRKMYNQNLFLIIQKSFFKFIFMISNIYYL
jgi:hypothetical protein